MARRKELKNIARGLYGSFISRNNDVGGYWGIGKLCLLAQRHEVTTIRLDLIEKSMAPASSEFTKLIAVNSSTLQKCLTSNSIPENWVVAAIICIDFKPEYPRGQHVPISTWGNIFRLSVTITDDLKKNYTVYGYGYCGAHNPKKEYKSARTFENQG